MPDNKIILVASPLGRVGTSATVGLLNRIGLDIGDRKDMTRPNDMNPKGYFELHKFTKFMKTIFGRFYGDDLTQLPTINQLREIAKKHADQYHRMLQREFTFPAVIKSQRYLTIPLFSQLDGYDVRVLCMHRKIEDQAKSTLRMWKKSRDPNKCSATEEVIHKHITNWIRTVGLIRKSYDQFPYLDVSFESLIAYPCRVTDKICSFADIPKPKHSVVTRWIDPKLVNRRRR